MFCDRTYFEQMAFYINCKVTCVVQRAKSPWLLDFLLVFRGCLALVTKLLVAGINLECAGAVTGPALL